MACGCGYLRENHRQSIKWLIWVHPICLWRWISFIAGSSIKKDPSASRTGMVSNYREPRKARYGRKTNIFCAWIENEKNCIALSGYHQDSFVQYCFPSGTILFQSISLRHSKFSNPKMEMLHSFFSKFSINLCHIKTQLYNIQSTITKLTLLRFVK